ncbi:hypothetical protein TRVL_00988 [Trypanosoma vivax]|uniref:Uncharacterized protein n=1 Tax=Trypanosoma vivax (strain Y486) TaxID=1055687 RepID=G0U1K1_TRYVY|nr:hypothetical protein TRVL_00988 [Trypanosoma vivax]CCC49958.1 hypothetical protein, unlikely [Trypanosoma vivax Y486]
MCAANRYTPLGHLCMTTVPKTLLYSFSRIFQRSSPGSTRITPMAKKLLSTQSHACKPTPYQSGVLAHRPRDLQGHGTPSGSLQCCWLASASHQGKDATLEYLPTKSAAGSPPHRKQASQQVTCETTPGPLGHTLQEVRGRHIFYWLSNILLHWFRGDPQRGVRPNSREPVPTRGGADRERVRCL